MTESKAVYSARVYVGGLKPLPLLRRRCGAALPPRRIVGSSAPHLHKRRQQQPRGCKVFAQPEFEEEYEHENQPSPKKVMQAEVFEEPEIVENTSLTVEEKEAPLDIASAADMAVGDQNPQSATRDEVSELVHKEAKYTELEQGPHGKKTSAAAAGAVGGGAKVPEFERKEVVDSSVVVDAYEVLDSHAVVENISNVVIPETEPKPKEVHIPNTPATTTEEESEEIASEVLKERESSLSLKQVLAFSLPALAGVLTDPLMSFVDTACVGKMSTLELAAMGPNTAIYNFVLQIFTCFIVYTCGQVSKLLAKGSHDKIYKLISHALFLGVVTGTVVAAGLIGFSTPLLASLDTLPELMAPAASYLKIRALSLPAVLVCMVSGAFCLGRKDSKTPLLVAIASTITNLLGDMVLIFGPAKMGISGAALATTASVYVGAAYFLWKVSRQVPLRFSVPGWQDIKPFLTTSSFLTIRNMSIMVNYIAMTMFVGAYGTLASASHQVAISIFMIGCLAAEPFSQCAQSFLSSIGSLKSRSPGEHKYLLGAMKLMASSTFVCGGLMALMTLGMCNIPQLFTADPMIARQVSRVSPLVATAVWLSCINCVTDGFTFAALDLKYSATMAVVNVRLLFLILNAGKSLGFGFASVWAGMGCFYALRLTQNVTRILFLNKSRLSKEKYA
jgi:MATE family multidrug resistance protein